MKMYIDSEFKCHTSNPDGAFREVETDFFTGKCATFIKGYRYIPNGESQINTLYDFVAIKNKEVQNIK